MPQLVQLGDRRVEFPSAELGRLKNSRSALEACSYEELNESLQQDGYIYLPGAIPKEDVLRAREHLLKEFSALNVADSDGTLRKGCDIHCVPFMEGNNKWTQHPLVLNGVLQSKSLETLFDGLFGRKSTSLDYKWLRAVPSSAFTGVHLDRVYMCRGTEQLLTCWVPFGPVPVEMGSLCMLERSHVEEGFNKLQETYGNVDFEASGISGSGWFSTDPAEVSRLGGRWKTENFDAGDVLVFTMRTLHMSARNTSNKVRISCDARWQPAEEPKDPRYVGKKDSGEVVPQGGLYGDESADTRYTMEQKKLEWGLAVSEEDSRQMDSIWGELVPSTTPKAEDDSEASFS